MPRPWLFTLALVLLAGVTALVFWPEAAPVQVDADEHSVTVEQGIPGDRAEAETEAPPLHTGESHLNTRVEEAPVVKSAETDNLYPAYSGDHGVTVITLDLETELPVPQTDIYYLNPQELDEEKVREFGGTLDFKAIIQKFGRHYRSNEQAKVQIAPPAEYSLLLAEQGNRSRLLSPLEVVDGQIVVRLKANVRLVVRVIDTAGNAITGVPVGIRMERKSYSSVSLSARTDSDGKATWKDLNAVLERLPGDSKLYAAIEIPIKPENATESQSVELTEQVLQAGTATLTMPPTGKVRVAVVDSRGQRYSGAGVVRIFANADQTSFLNSGPVLVESVVDGMAEFPYVGLGSPLEVVFLAEGSMNQDRTHIDSPQRVGEWVETTIIHVDRPTLTGILLDPDGEILADQSISISIRTKRQKGSSSRRGTTMNTDAEGRFRHELQEDARQGSVESRVLTLKVDLEKFGQCRLEQTLPTELPAADFDLGELTLVAEPFLLAGKVLDLQGVPIALASVQIFGSRDEGSGVRMNFSGAQIGASFGAIAHDQTDQEGNFRLQGTVAQGDSLKVEIRAKGYETLTQPISLGADGLEFRLNRASILAGSLLLAEGIEARLLKISMTTGESSQRVHLQSKSDSDLQSFRYEGKANTTYTFKITTRYDEVIFESSPFQLQAGTETRPPELQPLDLRGVLRSITIRAQDNSGVALNAGVYRQDSDQNWSGQSGDLEGTTILLSQPIAKLYVYAEGYAGQLLENVSSDQLVTLQAGMEVTLQIPAKLVHYREFVMSIQVWPANHNQNTPNISGIKVSSFDRSGQAIMQAPQTGDHYFNLRIKPEPGHPGRSAMMGLGLHKITAGGQVIDLKIDQAELDKKIDELTQ
jgi:hypothetical protein